MEIKRDSYLQQLISYRFDGLVKVITGIRWYHFRDIERQ